MSPDPFISVIVPVRNAAGTLDRAIGALLAQRYPTERVELIAVENASSDASASILARYPGVVGLREPRPGAYRARNLGIAAASGEIIAFTDADCVASPGWLAAIAEAHRAPGVMLTLGPCPSPAVAGLLAALDRYEAEKLSLICADEDRSRYFGLGANMAVKRAALARVGPFEERPRGGDTALVQAVVAAFGAGAVTESPAQSVTHLEIESLASFYRKRFLYARAVPRERAACAVRALSTADRARAFARTVRAGRMGPLSAAALLLVLAGGVGVWALGRASPLPRDDARER